MTDTVIESDVAADAVDRAPVAADERTPRPRPFATLGAWLASRTASEWVTFAIVAGCAGLVFWSLQPQFLLSDTIPTGGDMSAHVWGPAFLRDHLLPKGQLTGWSPDWYAGYPAFQFYMLLPFLAIALLSYVIPYGVAFKLVAVSGCVALPVACYLFGRLTRLPFPVPPLLAMGGSLFLYDRSFSIYGGNIASTLAGEFCFSISLSLAIVFLGVVGAGLRTGKYRGAAALLLALTGLCHLIPMMFAVVAMLLWFVVRPGKRSGQYLGITFGVGALLTAFWSLPFVAKGGYSNDMGWEKVTTVWSSLVTRDAPDSTLRNIPDLRVLIVLAVVGLVLAAIMRYRDLLYLGLVAVAVAASFVYLGWFSIPVVGDKLWNARLLPFYYLMIYLLAAAAVGLGCLLLARLLAGADEPLERGMRIGAAVIAGLALFVVVGGWMKILPGGSTGADGVYRWSAGPLKYTVDPSYVSDWATWNFQGLEGWEQKPEGTDANGNVVLGPVTYDRSYPEFYHLIQTMKQVGAEHGCGRAMWEYEDQHNRYGSPMEPMLLPYFTDSCIGSMEGLYFEASSTTPYHFINSTELSQKGSAAQRDMPYSAMPPSQADFDLGIGHLQMLGVRYYLAIDDATKALAAANPSLSEIAQSDSWTVYLVADSDLVVPLKNEPAVLTGQATTGKPWLATSVCWYMHPENWDVPLVDRAEGDWQQVSQTVPQDPSLSPQEQCRIGEDGWGWFTDGAAPQTKALPTNQITNVKTTMDGISFDVSTPGVPVLVKTSYFPNWKVSGADGIARSTPNLMVVTPTSSHVELSYGRTGIDYVAYLLTLIGIVGLVLLFRARRLVVPAPVRYWWPTERPDLLIPPPVPSTDPLPYGEAAPVPFGHDQAEPAEHAELGGPIEGSPSAADEHPVPSSTPEGREDDPPVPEEGR